MPLLIKKTWPHILFWSVALAYFIAAPSLYYQWFVTDGKTIASMKELPPPTGEFKVNIEYLQLYDEKGTYELEGWSFLTMNDAISVEDYKREVILASPGKLYNFEIEPMEKKRRDVTEFYKYMERNLDESGFRSRISIYALKPADYEILILFRRDDGQAVYIDTYRCITRTPNYLLLKDRGSSCH
jgi:hypothetical protein